MQLVVAVGRRTLFLGGVTAPLNIPDGARRVMRGAYTRTQKKVGGLVGTGRGFEGGGGGKEQRDM